MIIDREEFCLEDFNGKIEINVKKLILTIKGHVLLKEWIKKEKLDLVINLSEDATLEYNRYGAVEKDTKIIINQSNNTKLCFKESFIANNDTTLKIENNIVGNNNTSEVIVRATSKNISNVLVDATLNLEKNTFNNEVKEDLRGLERNNSKIKIIPNMLVASSEVLANHNVTIGNVDEDNLFYLNSKGLSKEESKRLLEAGFLISIFEDEKIKEQIKEIIK